MAPSCIRYDKQGSVALVGMDAPPVNAFSLALRTDLLMVLEALLNDVSVAAVVLYGCGRGFSAGGDIREFGTPKASASPGLSSHIHALIESAEKPVIAALHGLAIGGGLETALVCHYRVAEETTQIALPEVTLGTLPLSGTQRLPRILGVSAAFDFISEGVRYSAADWKHTDLFDRVTTSGQGLQQACEMAYELAQLSLSKDQLRARLVREWHLAGDAYAELEEVQQKAQLWAVTPAQKALLEAFSAAVTCADFDQGLARSRALYDSLMTDKAVISARDRFITGGASAKSVSACDNT